MGSKLYFVENHGDFSNIALLTVLWQSPVQSIFESEKFTKKGHRREWKIIHHWVSFLTQIDKSWDTVFGRFSLLGRVKEMTHKAFWDILKQQLESDPPDYTQALSLMTEVKQVSHCVI